MWSSKNITLVLIFLLILINAANVRCDELSDMLAKMEALKQSSESYSDRIDNSDLYTESLTSQHTDYESGYDFVVVGAGSAGAIIAKKLSQMKFKTLLLEAGEPQTDVADFAGLWIVMQFTNLNWGYRIKPQKHLCQGMINKQCKAPRGKALGGTSTINGAVYARGNSYDQNAWQDYGADGWSWADTLPYLLKLENYEQLWCEATPTLHGCDGPVHIDVARPNYYIDNAFLNANEEVYRVTPDYNGAQQMGAGKIQFNKRNGRRESSARVFLNDYEPAYLKIETKAFVHKIIFDGQRAIGVDFIKNNEKNYRVLASKEVIISAGSFNSPQLLMWSGIGPKEELNRHGIPAVADLPVGKNLDDHVAFIGLQIDSDLQLTDPKKVMRDYVFEALSGVGEFTAPAQSLSFISTIGNTSVPDVEILLLSSGRPLFNLPNVYNLDRDSIVALTSNIARPDNLFALLIILQHQKAKGTVTLKSRSPLDFPVIDQNSLSELEDIETIYNAMAYIKRLLNSKAFKAINAKIIRQVLKACEAHEYDSKDYWLCTIRHLSLPCYHSTGTCRMGKKGSSVVDSELKVHGIDGLRVVDNSIIPNINSGHPNAIAMMIGLKAADIVKKDYQDN